MENTIHNLLFFTFRIRLDGIGVLMADDFNIMEISLNTIDFKTFFLFCLSLFVLCRGGGALTHDSKAFWLYSARTDATQEKRLFIIDSIKST